MKKLLLGFSVCSLLLIGCGSKQSSDQASMDVSLPAWPSVDATSGLTLSVISEVSDLLPRVDRQIGPDGPIRPFLDDPEGELMLRARVAGVEPWYSVRGGVESDDGSIGDTGRRTVEDYGATGSLWSMVKVTLDVTNDYGEPTFDAEQLVVSARGTVDDFDPYVGADVLAIVVEGVPYHGDNEVMRSEWSLGALNPIGDQGVIIWREDLPIGRSSSIDAFETIAEEGEIVVTKDAANPPIVVERHPRE